MFWPTDLTRRSLELLVLVAAAGWSTACTGGVPCPKSNYDVRGEPMDSFSAEETAACLASDPENCALNCVVCGSNQYTCEPCALVREWAEAECPGCLVEEAPRVLSLGCTTR